MEKIAVIGAGTMGSGIAQVAASAGHEVLLFDVDKDALKKASDSLQKIMDRQVEKGKMDRKKADQVLERVKPVYMYDDLEGADFVIEAIVENLEVKKDVFANVQYRVSEDAILATNTSSLSVASIAAACKKPERVIGAHFFNPAPLMPLVEIVPAVQTSESVTKESKRLIDSWGKKTVLAKDTPGFIVNRVARPFYGEAIRIYEEGFGDIATIDWSMKELGGFRMGPFELMDYIGNDVNYTVTETIWQSFYFDPRFKPSFTQKRMMEAGYLGRKTGRGYYDYAEGAAKPEPIRDEKIGWDITWRILVMLINEAADALYLGIASKEDIDMAMTKGVNYPKGLLEWADEEGVSNCLETLDRLYNEYHEERYRASPLLRKMSRTGAKFYKPK